MNPLRLVLLEIGYRKLNFVLGLLALASAAALFVAGPLLVEDYAGETNTLIQEQHEGSEQKLAQMKEDNQLYLSKIQDKTDAILATLDKKTKRTTRDMGSNLRIVHKDTNMSDFYTDFQARDMPESYVQRLVDAQVLDSIRHIVATLQQKIKWNNRSILLVGILPESTQEHRFKKAHMTATVEEKTVHVGHELAVGLKEGDKIDVIGEEFTVAKIMPEAGTYDDITLRMHLHDAQRLLDKPEVISMILALGCHCEEAKIATLRETLAGVLPEVAVTEYLTRRIARAEQRDAVVKSRTDAMARAKQEKEKSLLAATASEKAILANLQNARTGTQQNMEYLVASITPIVLLLTAIWIGLLTWINVQQRQVEIGILRAMGKKTTFVAWLFLGRALLLGLVGGAVGLGIGIAIITQWSDSLAMTSTMQIVIAAALLGSPLVALVATWPPVLSAVWQEPASALRDI